MSTSDKIAIAFGILALSGFTIKGTILYLTTNKDKMKTIFKNPYIHTFLGILALALLIALMPWDKFHYGDIKPKVVYVKVNTPPPLTKKQDANIDSWKREKTIRFKQTKTKASVIALNNKERKADTPKSQFDLRGAQIKGSAVGTNPTVTNNNYETPPRVFSKEDFLELSNGLSKVLAENSIFDKNSTIRYLVAIQDAEASKFADQIYNQMFSNGYKNSEVRYAIFTGIRPTNLTVSKGSENGKDFITIEIHSQKSVNVR